MSKLDPRPEPSPLHSWEMLNNVLQGVFNLPGEQSALIDLRQYSLSKDEIIAETEKQGYKVFEEGEHHLRFK